MLKTEYIEAKSPKELVQYLNSFLQHIDKTYQDVPAVVMNPVPKGGNVGAFVFYQTEN
jgi:hypothetical protein